MAATHAAPFRSLSVGQSYTTEYRYKFRTYMSRYRSWLKTLPHEVAERIAFRNGLVLFDISDNKASDTGTMN